MTDAERTQFIARTPPPPVVLPHHDSDVGEPEHERRNGVIWAAIVVALLLVVGAGAFFVWKLSDNKDSTKKISVPNLVGLSLAQANTKLGNPANCETADNCKVFLSPDQDNPTTPGPCDDGTTPKEGLICKVVAPAKDTGTNETVDANTEIDQGSRLFFETYKKAVVNVPYVIGMSYGDAQSVLGRAGLKFKKGKDVNTFSQAKGDVWSQQPSAQTQVSPGATVTLRLSTGKAKLPDVRGMKSNEAKSQLNAVGFNLVDNTTHKKTTTDKAKDGLVFAIDPTPGNPYNSDVKITLTIYKYKKPAPTCDPAKTASTSASTSTSSSPPGLPIPNPSTTPVTSSTNTLPPCSP